MKKRKAGIDNVGVHAGIVLAYTGIGDMMKLVAERQRVVRREKKLHAQTSLRGEVEARLLRQNEFCLMVAHRLA